METSSSSLQSLPIWLLANCNWHVMRGGFLSAALSPVKICDKWNTRLSVAVCAISPISASEAWNSFRVVVGLLVSFPSLVFFCAHSLKFFFPNDGFNRTQGLFLVSVSWIALLCPNIYLLSECLSIFIVSVFAVFTLQKWSLFALIMWLEELGVPWWTFTQTWSIYRNEMGFLLISVKKSHIKSPFIQRQYNQI